MQPSFIIHGGSSGIGTAAISILKNYTDQIFVTAGSEEKCKAAENAMSVEEKDAYISEYKDCK